MATGMWSTSGHLRVQFSQAERGAPCCRSMTAANHRNLLRWSRMGVRDLLAAAKLQALDGWTMACSGFSSSKSVCRRPQEPD